MKLITIVIAVRPTVLITRQIFLTYTCLHCSCTTIIVHFDLFFFVRLLQFRGLFEFQRVRTINCNVQFVQFSTMRLTNLFNVMRCILTLYTSVRRFKSTIIIVRRLYRSVFKPNSCYPSVGMTYYVDHSINYY